MTFLLGYNFKIFIQWEGELTLGGGNKGIKIWCGGGEFNGGDFIIDIIHTLYICIYERTSSTGFFIQ